MDTENYAASLDVITLDSPAAIFTRSLTPANMESVPVRCAESSGCFPSRQIAGNVAESREGVDEDRPGQQDRAGERVGGRLVRRGGLSREQFAAILKRQARALGLAHRVAGGSPGLPYPAFFSLCLPAYNEQDNIEETLDAACAILPEFVDRFEIVVVNDGSSDRTGEIVARRAEADPRIRLITHARNRGYGAAVTSGLRAADGDLVAFLDSDGQFSLLDLPKLLALLKDCDVAIGYRGRRADPFHRRLNAWGWNRLVRLLLGVKVVDLDCAFKVFRRHAIDGLGSLVGGQAFNADLLFQCKQQGMRILETPVGHYPRRHGVATGANPRVILRAFGELARLWWSSRISVRSFAAIEERVPAESTF